MVKLSFATFFLVAVPFLQTIATATINNEKLQTQLGKMDIARQEVLSEIHHKIREKSVPSTMHGEAVQGASSRRDAQQLLAVGYGAEFLAVSDGCLGWDPVMDIVCGDGTTSTAESLDGGLRLGDETAPPAECSPHPELAGAIRCRIPSSDPDVPVNNFALVAFFLVGVFCYGPTEESVVARANFLPESLMCGSNSLAFHSVYIRISRDDGGLVDDFSCRPEESFSVDDDGIQYCLATPDCIGQSCSIPLVSAVQKTPIPDDAVLFLGTDATSVTTPVSPSVVDPGTVAPNTVAPVPAPKVDVGKEAPSAMLPMSSPVADPGTLPSNTVAPMPSPEVDLGIEGPPTVAPVSSPAGDPGTGAIPKLASKARGSFMGWICVLVVATGTVLAS